MIKDPLGLLRYTSIPVLLTLLLAVPAMRTSPGRTGDAEQASLPFLTSFLADEQGLVRDRQFLVGRLLLQRFRGGTAPAGDERIDVLIATVPDPVESSLDWAYDSYLVSIRRALEETGRVIDRSWFPSSRDSVTVTYPDTSGDSEPDVSVRVPQSDALPGVMLFRGLGDEEGRLTLVYLVGELPTAGVHREALRAALDERARILHPSAAPAVGGASNAGRDTIRVLGPGFSGSAESLRRGLDAWAAASASEGRPVHYRVATGAATASSVRSTLTGPAPEVVAPDAPTYGFSSTVHSNEAYMSVLETDVLEPLEIARDEVAFVVEGNTAYGRSLIAAGYTVVNFPTNIAALRDEYAENPRQSTNQTRAEPAPGPAPRLPLSLSTRPRIRENPPPRSTLTPAAVDLVLEQIGATLETHRIRAIGIMATDVRDKLFLSRLIKRRLRDVQLFTFESNILLLRSDFARSLRGTLVVSTYPLIAESQAWTGKRSAVLPFSHDGAQGVFNAALMLFDEEGAMIDYRAPGARSGAAAERSSLGVEGPPVWITTVGSGTFLPIRTVDIFDGYLTPARLEPVAAAGPDEHRAGLHVWMVLLAALCVAGGLHHVLVGRREGGLSGGEAGPRVRPAPDEQSSIPWIAGLSVVLPLAALSLSREAGTASAMGVILPVSFSVLLVGLPFYLLRHSVGMARRWADEAAWENGSQGLNERWRPGAPKTDGFGPAPIPLRVGHQIVPIAALALGLVAWAYAMQIFALFWSDYAPYVLYRFRVLRLDGGASPILPLALAGIAIACGRVWYRQRTELLAESSPLERVRGVNTPDDAPWTRSFRGAGAEITGIRDQFTEVVPRGWLGWVTLVVIPLVVVGLPIHIGFRTVEDLTFPELQGFSAANLIVAWTLIAALLTVAGSTLHVLRIWHALSKGLAKIAETPLLVAFGRVPDRIRALGRLNLFDPPSPDRGQTVSRAVLSHLDGLIRVRNEETAGEEATDEHATDEEATDEHATDGEVTDGAGRSAGEGDAVWLRAPPPPGNSEMAWDERVKILLEDLTRAWHERPELVQLTVSGQADEGSGPDVRLLREAESAAAVEVIRFLDWVLRSLRRIAILLLVAILLTTALLVSFPTPIRGQVTVVFIGIMMVSLGIVVMIAGNLSQDEVLSRVNETAPGKVTWNRASMLSVIVFVSLPILGLLAAEIPVIGQALFSWLDPVLRVLTNV